MKRKIILILSLAALVLFSGCSNEYEEKVKQVEQEREKANLVHKINEQCKLDCDTSLDNYQVYILSEGKPIIADKEVSYCKIGCSISYQNGLRIIMDNINSLGGTNKFTIKE